MPKRADIKTGFLCNNQCRFCVQGNKKRAYGNKSTNQVKKHLDSARKECDGIVFTGGEVTIRPDFLELVAHARSLGFEVIQVQTNGRMFAYKEFCKKTIGAGATEFSPALHGHIPELHDYLTGVPESFAQTVSGIGNLKALEQKVITNSVVTKSNYRHLPELARLLIYLGVDQFQVAFAHPLGNAADNFDSVVPRFPLIEPFVKRAMDEGRKAGVPCMAEAMPCCFMAGYEDYIAEKVIPDTEIYDQNVTIKDYGQARRDQGKAKGERCGECKRFEVCEGPWREYPERYGWSEFKPIV